MKIQLVKSRRTSGGISFSVVWITLMVSLILAAYLNMVSSQNYYTMRSQAWNSSISVIEAGIEEALAHLNKNGTTNVNFVTDGWVLWGGTYYKRGYVGSSFYDVTITTVANPVITCRGYSKTLQNYAGLNPGGLQPFLAAVSVQFMSAPDGFVYRTVQCNTMADGMWSRGLVAKYHIDMNGNNIRTDSFDSADPSYSVNGQYSLAKAKDNGDVATVSGLTNSANVNVGNGDIHGHVATGPGGSVSIGSNGSVGSDAWRASDGSGLQPGWFRDDMNVTFNPVGVPFTGGYFTPGSATVGGTGYNYVLGSGNYQLSSFSMSGQGKAIVTGNAVLYVTGNFSMAGQSSITLATNATLKLYVGMPGGTGNSATIGGQGIINSSGYAANFSFFGLPSTTSLSFSGNAGFMGAIYAPTANFTLNGGGNNTIDFIGASVSATVTMNGHMNFHYDENLGKIGPRRAYLITSWNEL